MLGAEDEKLIEEWYRVLMDTEEKFQRNFREFMGEHNRRMLAYFAGLPGDRQRLIVMHGWQIHDHMCNTGRANASEWDWRFGMAAVLAFSALAFAVEQEWIVVGAYLGGAVFFLFRPIWRKYLSWKDD